MLSLFQLSWSCATPTFNLVTIPLASASGPVTAFSDDKSAKKRLQMSKFREKHIYVDCIYGTGEWMHAVTIVISGLKLHFGQNLHTCQP